MRKISFVKINVFKESGQSLVEVLVALSLVVIIILGLVRVTITSVRNASFAKDQRVATKYAQEGLENARHLKEEDTAVFWAKSGTETDEINKFTREITYTPDPGQPDEKMKVEVLVWWEDSIGQHQSTLATYLTKWK